MTANKKLRIEYDEKAIQTLDALEHIRLRTGMYIGRIGDGSNPADGIYVMLKEVIDNAVDEFIMGHGKRVVIRRRASSLIRTSCSAGDRPSAAGVVLPAWANSRRPATRTV